jgi:hypothetical protein
MAVISKVMVCWGVTPFSLVDVNILEEPGACNFEAKVTSSTLQVVGACCSYTLMPVCQTV